MTAPTRQPILPTTIPCISDFSDVRGQPLSYLRNCGRIHQWYTITGGNNAHDGGSTAQVRRSSKKINHFHLNAQKTYQHWRNRECSDWEPIACESNSHHAIPRKKYEDRRQVKAAIYWRQLEISVAHLLSMDWTPSDSRLEFCYLIVYCTLQSYRLQGNGVSCTEIDTGGGRKGMFMPTNDTSGCGGGK